MPQLIINTYVSLMYELKKIGKLFTSKFVWIGTSSYKKRIYRAAVSQSLRNTDLGIAYSSLFSVVLQVFQATWLTAVNSLFNKSTQNNIRGQGLLFVVA